MKKPLKSIIEQPELQVYIADFGKADDWCLVAETKEKIVGAIPYLHNFSYHVIVLLKHMFQ